jgi:NADPH-dependent 2,4-dienoyl-CoA reductase/sulfur reductase-like enzyme
MAKANYDLVVVGGGAAGLNAAFSCRQRYPEKSVLLIDGESEIGYYRTLLPMFMAGNLTEEKLFFWKPGSDENLDCRTGVQVRALNREAKSLDLDNGESVAYERLILASGGQPIVPPVFESAVTPDGVFPVRSLAMARQIKDWLPDHRDIVVLGGGLVGSKTSVFLRLAGFNVTLVEKEAHILPTVLSADTARPLQRHLENMGVVVKTNTTIDRFEADGSGAVTSVRLASGDWLPCGTFLVGIGSAPDLSFLEETGLVTDGELVVSPTLQTDDPEIFAIGDAIHIRVAGDAKHNPWTWPQAVTQGKLAGANAFRTSPVRLKRTTRVNAQNISGIPLMILGGPGVGSSIDSRPGPGDGVWREFFMDDGHIVGGALVGDIAGAGPLHFTMAGGADVSGSTDDLLKPRTRAFGVSAWSSLGQARRARILPAKGS